MAQFKQKIIIPTISLNFSGKPARRPINFFT